MLNRLPVEINPFRLVEQHKQLSGVVAIHEMARLSTMTTNTDGTFTVALAFQLSDSHLPMVTGTLSGDIALECQRCLQAVDINITHPIATVFVTNDQDQRPEQQGYDLWLVEEERLFLRDFIEDEILLSLPFIARHDHCQFQYENEFIEADDKLAEPAQVDNKDNPFAILKNWNKPE